MTNIIPSTRAAIARFSRRLSQSLLLGIGTSLLITSGDAQAVETIRLINNASSSTAPAEVTWSLEEIREFVRTGGLRQPIRDFLGSSNQDPGILQRAFAKQVEIPENLGNEFLDTSLGQLMVSQVAAFVRDADPVPNLRTALRASIQDDRRISLIEIMENYPTETVTVDITGLVRTYDSVVAIVNDLMPVLQSAKETLRGVVCPCEQAPGTPRSSLPTSTIANEICNENPTQ